MEPPRIWRFYLTESHKSRPSLCPAATTFAARYCFTDLSLEALAVFGCRCLMCCDAGRKLMCARSIGPQHEIQRAGFGWFEHSFDRRQTRVGDGAWRQSGMAIGVVEAVAGKVRAVDNAAISI